MTVEEFMDVLFDAWNDLYDTNEEIDFDEWRKSKITKTVSDLSKDPALEQFQDTRFVRRTRELFKAGTTVAAFTVTRYKTYRADGKTWEDLADYLRRSQRKTVI
jgi:hypothetical protein